MRSNDVVQATRSYERWLAAHTEIVAPDMRHKRVRMDESPFVFLRASYYRWAQQWASVVPEAADAPVVIAVGDLHMENFGTWRDTEGRLIWGINDFDEAAWLPYTNDLTRLVASANMAI